MKTLIPVELIERHIYLVRGHKVMLDADLARLYGVETKALNRAVRRNRIRFPEDFMLVLTLEEASSLRCQIGTSKASGRGGLRYRPLAFTEQGVAMLSSILHGKRAAWVNIAIMRAFVKVKNMLAHHHDLAAKLKELEERMDTQDSKILAIFNAMKQLIDPPRPKPRRIGFKAVS